MKVILAITMQTLAALCLAQPPQQLTDYANFKVEDESIIWRLVYDRAGISVDSIKHMIFAKFSLDVTMQLIEEKPDYVNLKMMQKVFEKEGDKITGLVTIEAKDERYRVTLRGLTRTMGIKTMRTARLFGVGAEVSDYNGVRFEDDYLNRSKTGFKSGQPNMRGLDYWSRLFESGFDVKAGSMAKKDDW
jgi:hypothetical protein